MKRLIILLITLFVFTNIVYAQEPPIPDERVPSEYTICVHGIKNNFGYVYSWSGKVRFNNQYFVICKIKYIENYSSVFFMLPENRCKVKKAFLNRVELINVKYNENSSRIICVYIRK